MIRDPKALVFMDIAKDLSRLGTCDRKRVGAIIVRDGRCVSWGYNGAPPGMPHCDENDHARGEVDWSEVRSRWGSYGPDSAGRTVKTLLMHAAAQLEGCQNATHAEANALAFAARQGISTDGCTLYVTVSPCEVCARLLIAAGIKEVAYDEEYRERGGIDLLYRAGLTITRP